jgi:Tfp pilus assembly protein PilP
MKYSRYFNSALLLALITTSSFAKTIEISKEILKQRDPFKKPIIAVPKEGPQSELEIFPLEKLKMLGVMTGGEHLRAMVQAPNGKTYFVQERMTIGDRKGVIKKITDQEIIVREKVVNVLGIEETVSSTIQLPPDSKQDVKKLTSEKGW